MRSRLQVGDFVQVYADGKQVADCVGVDLHFGTVCRIKNGSEYLWHDKAEIIEVCIKGGSEKSIVYKRSPQA